MTETKSGMLQLGTIAPEFSLPGTDGQMHSLGDSASAYLVMFICNHFPYVKHVREELARLGNDYLPRNVSIIAINSNDATTHPGDSPDNMRKEVESFGYRFPYLIDESQDVALSYFATCTPDVFLFDANKRLVYRGQLDGSRPSNTIAVNGRDIRAALDAVLANQPVAEAQIPSIGCSIKWRPGNEPAW